MAIIIGIFTIIDMFTQWFKFWSIRISKIIL